MLRPKVYKPSVMEVLMRQHNISQATLGREIGRDQAFVSNVVTGAKKVDADMQKKIADAIGLSIPEELMRPYNPERQEDYCPQKRLKYANA